MVDGRKDAEKTVAVRPHHGAPWESIKRLRTGFRALPPPPLDLPDEKRLGAWIASVVLVCHGAARAGGLLLRTAVADAPAEGHGLQPLGISEAVGLFGCALEARRLRQKA